MANSVQQSIQKEERKEKSEGIKKKCRISRNKKQYWKKGAKIEDVEEFFHQIQYDKSEGGLLWERKDENLFSIDRKPISIDDKLTRRQMAALMKRLKKKELVEQNEKNMCKQQLKRTFPKKLKKLGRKIPPPPKNEILEAQATYDLWGEKENSKGEISEAVDYYLRVTKKKLPREPSTLKHITSVLPHVEVDAVGASYNPPVSKYLAYASEIAKEEVKKIKEIEKIERKLALAPGETYVTEEEIEADKRAGLDENSENEDETKADDNDEEKPSIAKPKMKPRTKKARRKENLQKKRKEMKIKSKLKKEQLRLIYSARKMNKEISQQLKERNESAEKRKKHKLLKRFAGTQRLGRGKFEPYEKPVLLVSELSGTLREVKPQGSIIKERLKSLQKRNMLPVPGERSKRRKLKKKLRFKKKENWKHKEVLPGTTFI